MKRLIVSSALALLLTASLAQGLNRPESVAFDPGSGFFFVSNTGDGSIVKTTDLKNYSYLAQNKGKVRGLFVNGRKLYAASDVGLLVFDLDGMTLTKTVPVPGSSFLNDVTADGRGRVYLMDNQEDKIFEYDPVKNRVAVFTHKGIQAPNGIWYDAKQDRLLVVSLRPNSPLQAISLPGGVITTLKATSHGSLDGLGRDDFGNIYYSSWQTSSIYRLKDLNSEPERVVSGLSGPADFYVWQHQGEVYLLIPELTGSKLKVVEVTP